MIRQHIWLVSVEKRHRKILLCPQWFVAMEQLKRTINWKMLALYGLGNILGAGIYVLIGEVAAESGQGLVWSFLLAALVASFTAWTYSEFASKYPLSAGAALYAEKAFKIPALSTFVGLTLAFTALVSSSTLLRGFARYAKDLFATFGWSVSSLPDPVFMAPILGLLSIIALKGISESAKLAAIFTLLEAGGLVLIVMVAIVNGDAVAAAKSSVSSIGSVDILSICIGGFLAFYAFIGFEDMVNIAEEVKDPQRNMRRGMLTALVIATLLYVVVGISSLSILSSAELASQDAPLAAVFKKATGSSIPIITIIGVVAITNGVLIQIITSSRIIYGLAREGWIPLWLGAVNTKSGVPVNATLLSIGGIAIGSSLLPLGTLAQITSFTLLVIFTVVQVSALKLVNEGELTLPRAVPIIGTILNVGIVLLQVLKWAEFLPK